MKVEGLKAVNSSIEFQAETLLESFLISTKHKPTVKDSIRTTVLSFYKKTILS
jgi:hypothetical protein